VVTEADDGVWWLAGDGQWHEGTPPAGWIQAGDRRWYPDEPPETAKGYASKFESAGGRTATVLALVGRTDAAAPAGTGDGAVGDAYDPDEPAWLPDDVDDPADSDDAYDAYDTYGPGEADDVDGETRRRPAWVLVTVLAALLLAVVTVVGLTARTDGGSDGETGPTVDTAPGSSAAPTSTTTVTAAIPATTIDAGPLGPSVTVAPPVTGPSTTIRRESEPSTTIPPDPAGPPATGPNPGGPPGQATIREGGPCVDVGQTAVAANGTPVTCATTACDGVNYEEPRWRRTTC
jgi:hypothetical protein